MGFDLYSLKTTIPEGVTETNHPELPRNAKHLSELSEAEQIAYNEQLDKYYDTQEKIFDHPGNYFRNNVWWWRPLWATVAKHCADFITENDIEQGCYNNGHKITKTKARKIAKRLKEKIADNTIPQEIETYETERLKMEKQAEAETDRTKQTALELASGYPASLENVEEFIAFCEKCEGFMIC